MVPVLRAPLAEMDLVEILEHLNQTNPAAAKEYALRTRLAARSEPCFRKAILNANLRQWVDSRSLVTDGLLLGLCQPL